MKKGATFASFDIQKNISHFLLQQTFIMVIQSEYTYFLHTKIFKRKICTAESNYEMNK